MRVPKRDIRGWGSAQTRARRQEGRDGICKSQHFYILNDYMAGDKQNVVAFDGGCKMLAQATGWRSERLYSRGSVRQNADSATYLISGVHPLPSDSIPLNN